MGEDKRRSSTIDESVLVLVLVLVLVWFSLLVTAVCKIRDQRLRGGSSEVVLGLLRR